VEKGKVVKDSIDFGLLGWGFEGAVSGLQRDLRGLTG